MKAVKEARRFGKDIAKLMKNPFKQKIALDIQFVENENLLEENITVIYF